MMNLILDETREKMEKALVALNNSLDTVRTGRANTNLVSGVEVDYYGSPTPLNQIASISVQEGKIIVIKPFDASSLKNIEKAINASNLGLPPQSDGTVIRLSMPALTGETRKALCKDVDKYAENAKVAIRNVRRDANETAKKEESLSEDLEKQCLEKIQKCTDEFVKKVDELSDAKQKEIMTI